jgi:hypothetical protein
MYAAKSLRTISVLFAEVIQRSFGTMLKWGPASLITRANEENSDYRRRACPQDERRFGGPTFRPN